MRAVKDRDTKPELAVRRLLHRMGYRLRDGAAMSVLDACGVPRALAESADGTAAR